MNIKHRHKINTLLTTLLIMSLLIILWQCLSGTEYQPSLLAKYTGCRSFSKIVTAIAYRSLNCLACQEGVGYYQLSITVKWISKKTCRNFRTIDKEFTPTPPLKILVGEKELKLCMSRSLHQTIVICGSLSALSANSANIAAPKLSFKMWQS